MDKIFILMSHNLSDDQAADLKKMGFVPVIASGELRQKCGRIDPKAKRSDIHKLAFEVLEEAEASGVKALMVMGEPSLFANVLKFSDLPAFVATTERISEDVEQPDGTVIKKSVFKHVQFRLV